MAEKEVPSNKIEDPLNHYLSNYTRKTKLLVSLVVIGLVLFLTGAAVFPFKDKILNTFYPKKESNAQTVSEAIINGRTLTFLKLFGQKGVGETAGNLVTGHKIFHAAGVIVDKSSKPNKVYIIDGGNNRILGFNGIGTCSNNTSRSCNVDVECQITTNSGSPGGTCNVDGTKDADIVFGQVDMGSSACNRDNNLGINKKPGADTLCFMPYPAITNVGEYWMRVSMDVDNQGNLYVPDYNNNRILKFNQPFSTDKTNGKGDTLADFVWGQNDLASNGINRHGDSYPSTAVLPTDNRSLWISGGRYDWVSSRGVSVDQSGNVWVADTFNSRVLRFPANPSTTPNLNTADLVLGEPNFTTGNCVMNGALNTMCVPTLAKIDPDTGDLYVLDEWPGFNARILVFKAPFTNGMSAYKKIIPNVGPNFTFQSTGFAFNPFKQGEYAQGKLWVNENNARRTLLLDENGNVVKIIGARDISQRGGDGQYNFSSDCGNTAIGIYDPNKFYLNWPGGSIGFDDENNIYLADEYFHRISRYKLPYDLRIVNGVSCLPEPNGGMFKGLTGNIPSDATLGSGIGLAIFGNQLIVQDSERLKVWNDYLNKPFGSNADFIITNPDGSFKSRSLISDAIDNKNRLWLFNAHGWITIYQLPFVSNNDRALVSWVKLYWQDTQQELQYNAGGDPGGITFDKINKKLYIVDRGRNRILRVSNYDNFKDKLFVDLVIGQPDKNTVKCNHNQDEPWMASGNPTADSLCSPMQAKFDKQGNLYVVENRYECHGNDRVTLFTAADLRQANTLFPNLQAKKAFVGTLTSKGPCAYNSTGMPGSPVSIAFNSRNEMVVGNDGYYGDAKTRHLRQLWLYRDPLNKQTPDAYIDLPMGAPGELAFDQFDNLFVQDHTWNRVWGINLDKDWFTPTPTPTITPTPLPNKINIDTSIQIQDKIQVY